MVITENNRKTKMTKYMKKTILFAAALALGFSCHAQELDSIDFAKEAPVIFGQGALNKTLGGVSAINMQEITNKNYSTYAADNLQGYVGGYNGASLWGMDDALVLIDGVPRDINNVKPDEIAHISLLKGAQAVVLYGSRGAKGVILITTKRGTEGKMKIDVRANTGWYVAKSFPEYLGSGEYMTYYNQARANDGLAPLYTENDIYNYSSGLNPYRYPNINLYSSDYIKKAYNRTDATAEISGGGKLAKYYANVGYYRMGDLINFGEAKNDYTQRFNVRGNVDFTLNDWISAVVDANVSFYDVKSPAGANFWESAATMRPNRVSPLLPLEYIDPNAIGALTIAGASQNIINGCILGGTLTDKTNVIADYYAAGKSKWTSRQFQFDMALNFQLDKILKGLSFHTQFALDYNTSYTTSFNNEYATFQPTWANYQGHDVIVGLNANETQDKKSGVQNVSNSDDDQVIAFNAHLDYNRTFNSVHNVSAMALINGYQQTLSGEYHRISNANFGFMAAYNYAQRYFANFSGAIVHSARFAEGHREAFSPSASLGWNVAKEDFMKGSIFNDLTLSASASILNTDYGVDGYYLHKGSYVQDKETWWGWREGVSLNPTISERGSNPDLTFLKRKEFSVNLKAALFNNMLTADVSFFTSKLDGKIITATNLFPSYFSVYYPNSSFFTSINHDADTRTGFDFSVYYQKKWNDFALKAGVSGTYYTTKASKRDDTQYTDAYQKRQGHALDATWGYECLGFFKDQADIDNSPSQKFSNNVKPGDLKYKDQNGDGVIDSKDQIDLGKAGWYGNPLTLGFNLTAKYKDFTLFVLCTGGFGAKGIKNNDYWWIAGDDKYSVVVRDAWTPETVAKATYPRLTTLDASNNEQTSTFWLYKTDRFDLAKVQITYDMPKKWFTNKWVSGLSVYVSGSNLVTFAKEKKILEMNVGSEPQRRFYNLGAKVSF